MPLLDQISAVASLGSLALSRPAQVAQGQNMHPVRVMPKRSQQPYRANENRRGYDATFRLDAATSTITPRQNDILHLGGEEWIIWRVVPSSAGSHWVLECMAPPTVGVIPIQRALVPDNMGGETSTWEEMVDQVFYAKVREASSERQLTAETASAIGRLRMAYPSAGAPADFDETWRVSVDGRGYEILSITGDDENPQWRNAVLAREQNE